MKIEVGVMNSAAFTALAAKVEGAIQDASSVKKAEWNFVKGELENRSRPEGWGEFARRVIWG